MGDIYKTMCDVIMESCVFQVAPETLTHAPYVQMECLKCHSIKLFSETTCYTHHSMYMMDAHESIPHIKASCTW